MRDVLVNEGCSCVRGMYWCVRDILVNEGCSCVRGMYWREGCIGVRGMYWCARDVLVCEPYIEHLIICGKSSVNTLPKVVGFSGFLWFPPT